MANKTFIAQQMNRFFQIMAQEMKLTDEVAMEIADLYEPWEVGKAYSVGTILKYGTNADGETQLYSVLQDHISQADWQPNKTASLYKAIGFDESGVAVWTQPLSTTDAYMKDDIVTHNDKTWISDIDNNVWEPGVYGWIERT